MPTGRHAHRLSESEKEAKPQRAQRAHCATHASPSVPTVYGGARGRGAAASAHALALVSEPHSASQCTASTNPTAPKH